MSDYRFLDMETYGRKKHFDYFLNLGNPYIAITVMVDVTNFYQKIKQENQPFFLSFLYLAANAANGIPELRQRIRDGRIVEYQYCISSHTEMKADGTFAYCQLDCSKEFDHFLPYARQRQIESRESGTIDENREAAEGFLFVSCIPWIHYSGLVQATPIPADSIPRISWGKYQKDGDKITMPLSLQVHHGLVDGIHLGQFFDALQTAADQW